MARLIVLLSFIVFSLAHMGASCQGTETGNPQNAPTTGGDENDYSNGDFGVATAYEDGWTVSEQGAPESGAGEPTADGDQPSPMLQEGIDTSEAPSTVFSDGVSTVTLYYVTLSEQPPSLLGYLQEVFPSRSFEAYSNGDVAGFLYNDPDPGPNGGDQAEYYFLNGTLLLYVVAEVFEENDGFEKFATIIESLRFE